MSISRVVPTWFAPQLDTSERMTKQQEALMTKVNDGQGTEAMMEVLRSPAPVFSLAFTRSDPNAPAAPTAPPPNAPAVGGP
jgi:hypothetical protein